MKWLAIRDSRGRESRTLFFVGGTIFGLWAALALLSGAFVWGWPAISANEYATAVATICTALIAVLGAWLGREWIDKKRGGSDV